MQRRDVLKLMGMGTLTGVMSSVTGAVAQESDAEHMEHMTAPNGAGYYRFALGEASVVVLSDGQGVGGTTLPNWGANPDKQEVYTETLRTYHAPIEPAINNFNPMLVDMGGHKLLIDTGLGNSGNPATGQLLKHLNHAGYHPDDITTVFITHGHPDHIQGLTDGAIENFPNAELVMGETEFNFWASQAEPSAAVQNNLIALKDRFKLINPGDEIISGVSAVSTPGHTVGHMAVLVSSGDKQLMHFGDAGGHFLLSLRHPENYLRFDSDKELVVQTRKELFARASQENLLVVGYHFAWPGVGYIKPWQDAYEFIPAFWTWS